MDRDTIETLWRNTVLVDDSDLDPRSTLHLPANDTVLEMAERSTWPLRPEGVEDPELAGGFELGELLGEGGMGLVHRARQRSLGREVAVKLMRSVEDGEAVKHFLSEARITAALDHPNILPVHELAVDEAGRPLLAMKLIEGGERRSWRALIVEQARAGALEAALEDNLNIVLAVCSAVAYAHSKGIVHLDLKPDNILLGAFDEVLVTDWGIAHSFTDSPSPAPPAAAIARPLGTPCYMAPELAEGEGSRIGPATDIYLLGAILQEMICGWPPHLGRGVLEVVLAAARSAPPRLPDWVPSELAAVVARACAADPAERYQSIAELRAAIRAQGAARESRALTRAGLRARREASAGHAFAFDEAIAAYRQALELWPANREAEGALREARESYAAFALEREVLGTAEAQISRLDPSADATAELHRRLDELRQVKVRAAARHRRGRLAVAALALILVLGLALALGQARRSAEGQVRLRARAEKGERAAAARAAVSEQALNTLITQAQNALSDQPIGAVRIAREELLDAALAGLLELREADVAVGRQATIEARLRLAELYLDMSRLDEALAELGLAEGALRKLAAGRAPEALRGLRDCLHLQGRVRVRGPKPGGGLAVLDEALTLARELGADEPEDRQALIALLSNRSKLRRLLGRAEGAFVDARQAAGLARRELAGADSEQAREQLARTLYDLALSAAFVGRSAQAVKAIEESLRLHEAVFRARPDLRVTRRFARTLIIASNIFTRRGQAERARALARRGLNFQTVIHGLDQDDPRSAIDVLDALITTAYAENALADSAGALARLDRGRAISAAAIERHPKDRLLAASAGAVACLRSQILFALGRFAEAREAADEAVARYKEARVLDDRNARVRRDHAVALARCADIAVMDGALDEALELRQSAVAIARALTAEDPKNALRRSEMAELLADLGGSYRLLGRLDEARPLLDEALKLYRELRRGDPEDARLVIRGKRILEEVGNFAIDAGELDRARAVIEKLAAQCERQIAARPNLSDRLDLIVNLARLAEIECRSERWEAAERFALRARPLAREALQDGARRPLLFRDMASIEGALAGVARWRDGDPEAALAHVRAGLALIEQGLERSPGHRLLGEDRLDFLARLAEFARVAGRGAEALEAVALIEKGLSSAGLTPQHVARLRFDSQFSRGLALRDQGQLRPALVAYLAARAALDAIPERLGDPAERRALLLEVFTTASELEDGSQVARTGAELLPLLRESLRRAPGRSARVDLLEVLYETGHFALNSGGSARALPLFDEALALARELTGEDRSWIGELLMVRSEALMRLGRYEDCRQSVEAYVSFVGPAGAGRPLLELRKLFAAHERLEALHQRAGRGAEALVACDKLVALCPLIAEAGLPAARKLEPTIRTRAAARALEVEGAARCLARCGEAEAGLAPLLAASPKDAGLLRAGLQLAELRSAAHRRAGEGAAARRALEAALDLARRLAAVDPKARERVGAIERRLTGEEPK